MAIKSLMHPKLVQYQTIHNAEQGESRREQGELAVSFCFFLPQNFPSVNCMPVLHFPESGT